MIGTGGGGVFGLGGACRRRVGPNAGTGGHRGWGAGRQAAGRSDGSGIDAGCGAIGRSVPGRATRARVSSPHRQMRGPADASGSREPFSSARPWGGTGVRA